MEYSQSRVRRVTMPPAMRLAAGSQVLTGRGGVVRGGKVIWPLAARSQVDSSSADSWVIAPQASEATTHRVHTPNHPQKAVGCGRAPPLPPPPARAAKFPEITPFKNKGGNMGFWPQMRVSSIC